MVLAFIAMLGVTGANLAGPWLIRSLVSIIEESVVHRTAGASQVINISLVLLLVYALKPALRALQVWATHVAGWGSVAAARKEIYAHLQTLSPKYYTTTRTGQIMSRAINDTHHFETLIAHVIPEVIVSFLPVSYTHLDVYKRQILGRLRRSLRTSEIPPMAHESAPRAAFTTRTSLVN